MIVVGGYYEVNGYGGNAGQDDTKRGTYDDLTGARIAGAQGSNFQASDGKLDLSDPENPKIRFEIPYTPEQLALDHNSPQWAEALSDHRVGFSPIKYVVEQSTEIQNAVLLDQADILEIPVFEE